MRSVAFVVAATLGATTPLYAADLAAPPQEPAPPPVLSTGPIFLLHGYFWAASVNGKTATLPPLPAAKLDLKFKDMLKDFNGGIQASAEMRNDRWIVLTDFMYSKVNPGGTLPGPYFSSANVTSQSVTVQGDLLYRFYTDQNVDFDLGAGVRYWNLDNKLEIKPGSLNLRIEHSESEDWFDPVIAARLIAHLNDRWSVSVLGDIGGFDVGSKLTYQVAGLVNYQWNDSVQLHAGYRLLSVDYKKDQFLYDVKMYGPMLGLTYKF